MLLLPLAAGFFWRVAFPGFLDFFLRLAAGVMFGVGFLSFFAGARLSLTPPACPPMACLPQMRRLGTSAAAQRGSTCGMAPEE